MTNKPPAETQSETRLIPDNKTLHNDFAKLGPGDHFVGRLRLKTSEEHLVVDLIERGVKLFPSGLAQLCSRSKVLQAKIYADFLVPGTRSIHDLHDLVEALNDYQRLGYGQVVTKKDRANAGMGINLWSSVEEVFNQASFGGMPFPFVMQPFYPECRDIRVIILEDYQEAYWRTNPHNFRNNLHCGGTSKPASSLSSSRQKLCRAVMSRGKFPYAHLDLMVTEDGKTYLAEINLRGGIKGALITPGEYQRQIALIHQRYRLAQGL